MALLAGTAILSRFLAAISRPGDPQYFFQHPYEALRLGGRLERQPEERARMAPSLLHPITVLLL